MNFTFNSENYGTTVEVTFEAVTLNEIEDMFKQFLRGSGFYLVEDDMSTKEQNSDTSEECVPQTDKVPWDTSDMAHRSGGLSVEQEPVPVGMTCKVWTHGCALFEGIDLPNETLLYTAPPKREWVGLTSEELAQLTIDNAGYPTRLTAAIEAKLKEKNCG